MKIYISGTTKAGKLRAEIISIILLCGHEVLDPASHGMVNEYEYTRWDLDAIDRADLILAFMDSSNPSGYGLNFEVGYGYAKGKDIVYFDQLGNDWRQEYFGMIRAVSTKCHGLDALRFTISNRSSTCHHQTGELSREGIPQNQHGF